MAGIGIKLNKIYGKRTIVSSLYGIGLSVIYTIAPMLVIMKCSPFVRQCGII